MHTVCTTCPQYIEVQIRGSVVFVFISYYGFTILHTISRLCFVPFKKDNVASNVTLKGIILIIG